MKPPPLTWTRINGRLYTSGPWRIEWCKVVGFTLFHSDGWSVSFGSLSAARRYARNRS